MLKQFAEEHRGKNLVGDAKSSSGMSQSVMSAYKEHHHEENQHSKEPECRTREYVKKIGY